MVSNSAVIRIDSPLMLRPLLFSPAARWLSCALQAAGVERFLLLTQPDLLKELSSHFPAGTQVCFLDDPALPDSIRSFAADCSGEVITITNPLWLSYGGAEVLANGGDLENDLLSPAEDDQPLALPLTDDPATFDAAQYYARLERAEQLMLRGVRIFDPQSVYIDPTVTVEAGTVLLPNVILRGDTHIGANCEIGPNTMIRDCTLGNGCVANSSQLNEAVFGENVNIGPFAYVRPGTVVGDNCKVGDFVEVKNAVIGSDTKLPHFIYVGDSDVGERCNFGCGSITCNYDGENKHRTTVGNDVFIGCNTNLVAPVTLGDSAFTAAGSTVTDSVPAGELAIARARQVNRSGWQRPKKLEK